MNSLSWMIYLAGVADGLQILFRIAACAATLAVAGCAVVAIMMLDGYSDSDEWALWRKITWRSSIGLVISGLLVALVPTSGTIYAIAASEMGEEVIKSPTATKAMKALDAWLDRQIAGEKE